MERLVIAAVIVAVVGVVATVIGRRRTPDAPTQRSYNVPRQLDRSDFEHADRPWLVAVFTSAVCDVCASVVSKARVLETDAVGVTVVEFAADRDLHDKYGIDAVPTLVVVDGDGVTRRSFLGPMTATDLWAAVAEAREPGSTPEPGLGDQAR